jgi:hypothetical protein
MSCEHCAGYSVAHCPCCAETKEDELTAYEQGAAEARCGELAAPNPFDDEDEEVFAADWECGFYEALFELHQDYAVVDAIMDEREREGV